MLRRHSLPILLGALAALRTEAADSLDRFFESARGPSGLLRSSPAPGQGRGRGEARGLFLAGIRCGMRLAARRAVAYHQTADVAAAFTPDSAGRAGGAEDRGRRQPGSFFRIRPRD